MSGPGLLHVNDLVVRFPAPGSGFLGLNKRWVHAVIAAGETAGPGGRGPAVARARWGARFCG